MTIRKILFILIASFFLTSCGNNNKNNINEKLDFKMNKIAENYVKLVLKVGQADNNYVDAYYGPADWYPKDNLKTSADTVALLKQCGSETDSLLDNLESLKDYKADKLQALRFRFLYKQLLAVKTEIFMLQGGSLTFDEESKALYDAVAPSYGKEHFQKILNKLNEVLPGTGEISERLDDFNKNFIIPKNKLNSVFEAAIKECRRRTLEHIKLPESENFKVEYVTDKPWSAYNWYKGNYFSVIQVNTDLPIYINRAIELAAHEGYPGHHVYNTLLEEKLVKKNKWMEYTVYPLYSPQSLIAEGTANFGIQMIFPGNEKIKFEQNVLFPLAGIDKDKAEKYEEVQELLQELNFAGNEAARNYLNKKWNKSEAVKWLEKYCLMSPQRAEQRIKFIKKYRSYVINYNLGEEIIKNYIEKNGGTKENSGKRWDLFKYILTSPQTPSGLINSTL
jgi:hypothetical protein